MTPGSVRLGPRERPAVRWKPMVARRPPKEAIQKLSAEDRAWLEQRLREYRRLLDYLRDH